MRANDSKENDLLLEKLLLRKLSTGAGNGDHGDLTLLLCGEANTVQSLTGQVLHALAKGSEDLQALEDEQVQALVMALLIVGRRLDVLPWHRP